MFSFIHFSYGVAAAAAVTTSTAVAGDQTYLRIEWITAISNS